MTIARRQLIDLSVARWYHCASRCVRRAFLLAEGPTNRKEWIENRIKELAEIFAIGIGGFSVMDLNPVAAGIADVPEASEYTSISTRVEHVEAQGQADRLEAAVQGSAAGSLAAGGLEESLWLCPIEDRRRFDSSREGMFDGLSLGSYLLVVDYTARLFRTGKSRISADLAGVFERLGTRVENWQLLMERLQRRRLFGRFFAASREKLQEVAAHLGVRRVANLAGCPAR
jgi:hypothetical protein